MKYYIEITLLPNAEIPLYFLWEKVYQQVHLALVEARRIDGSVPIGVSFPEYDADQNHLGNILRIFAQTSSELEELAILQWLSRLTDYVHITTIREVPESPKEYAFFKRVQTKSSNGRLARRKAMREGITLDEAMGALAYYKEKYSKLPYVRIKSLSSGKRYRLMISYMKTDVKHSDNNFSTYGLGYNSPVPLF